MSLLSFLSGSQGQSQKRDISSILDMVTYAASLVSNPSDIDVLLDTVRNVTAQLEPDQPLSQSDQARLVDVYLRLEHYLTTDDPVHIFKPDELRSKMTPSLRHQIDVSSHLTTAN